MSARHVPQRRAKASSPGAIIPGYDEGLVNQDAIVDGEPPRSVNGTRGPGAAHATPRSGLRRTSTNAAVARRAGESPPVNVPTTLDLYERAVTRALREGKTLSQLACEALELYVR